MSVVRESKKKWLKCLDCGCETFKAYYLDGVLTIICSECGKERASE